MRQRLVYTLLLAASAGLAGAPGDLQSEDLQAVRSVFANANPALDWFHVLAKETIDAADSVMVVEAAPGELRRGARERTPIAGRIEIGVFVVRGETNQVRLAIDTFSLAGLEGVPVLAQPTTRSAYLHFRSDYGLYHGSIKYTYDLSGAKPPVKIRYGIFALTSSKRESGKLIYKASFGQGGQPMPGWKERYADITISPRSDGSLPEYRVVNTPPAETLPEAPIPFATSDGDTVLVANTTPPGQPHQASGIYVTNKSGARRYFPAPIPTLEFYRSVLPGKQPGEIESDIGPFTNDGAMIWFANSFYDGEGVSGVGAIGTFDARTGKYEMRYLPEMAPWSGSALLLDGEELWVGLMRRPEGASYGGGLLRYNVYTGAVQKYAVPEVINTIDRLGDALYCGASDGLYMLRDDAITELRFEPNADGKISMVARQLRYVVTR